MGAGGRVPARAQRARLDALPQGAFGVVDHVLEQRAGEGAAGGEAAQDVGDERRIVGTPSSSVDDVARGEVAQQVGSVRADDLEHPLVAGGAKPVLGAEVMVDQAGGDAGRRRDRAHPHPEALFGEHADGRVPDTGRGAEVVGLRD